MRITRKKTTAALQSIVRVIPLLFILVMLMLHLVLPDKTFSRNEMRYLAQWPTFHVERVMDGSYKTRVETYFSDQFPFRNFWVHIQKDSNQILIKKDLILNFGQ
ncbi:hypothetical protein FYJ38_06100 [Clostridium sp. WB02_MRS01]|uniref:DHHW family protein n=1 Tax=Clostridium sp. WB02_MRS01 TaxID=2605777 RepID=UPI0012B3B26D|nr:DHHW family protein [Clostridium sp. WB02_MRS01]MSS08215.1 hypothetical protein [Clostridium sp. WB02_MRS01]